MKTTTTKQKTVDGAKFKLQSNDGYFYRIDCFEPNGRFSHCIFEGQAVAANELWKEIK